MHHSAGALAASLQESTTRVANVASRVATSLIAGTLFLALGAAAEAQVVIETPAPFDSAGRIMALTPPLATRIGLSPDAWPVTGDYEEARLYVSGAGDYVLTVHRRGGTIERHALTPEARDTLRAVVSRGMAIAGQPVAEERPELISEPARGVFVRNQMLIAAVIYGPAAAVLADEAAAYFLVTGGTFFALMAASRNVTVTRAQNHLATDGAYRGAFMARGLAFAFDVDDDDEDAWATSALLGGIAGSFAGFRLGRGYTDSEARAATFGSTTLAAVTAGIMGAAGAFDGSDARERATVGGVVAAGLLGYPLGTRYARRASYHVTAGDVMTLLPSGLIGAALAASPIVDSDLGDKSVSAILTAGYVAGVLIGDRSLVRRYDFTESEARLTELGAVAGGLVGLALATMGDTEAKAAVALAAGGALAGMALTVRIVEPGRAGARIGMGFDSERHGSKREASRARVEISPFLLRIAF